jgi:hypothetical protein
MKWILYWFLVGYGLNHGLIPQENAAMTALAINQTVVDDTGRTDLCVDYAAGNYTPNTRGFELLNEAQQFLDRMYRNRGEEDCLTIDVEAGDYQIDVPNIRHVTRMDMTAADGTRHELRRRSYAFMREQYGESFDLLDTGKPVDWARNQAGSPDVFPEPGDDWTDGTNADGIGNWSWSASTGVLSIDPSTGSANIINAPSGTIDESKTYVFSFALTVNDLGDSDFALKIFPSDTEYNTTGAYSVSLSGAALFGILSLTADQNSDFSMSNIRLVDSNAYVPRYIFLPPADQPYTLCVFGGYYTRKFEIGTDMSWWSDTYPGLLVMAYKMMIERHMHANDTRVNFWSGQIAFETKKLQIDLNEEDTAGPPKYMRRMPSAMWKRHQ